jgi:D-glycero-alpha-D-manno-heptose-7-phosphate kinase
MIFVRSPLRITLGGGGTDLPSFYKNYGGFCVSAAIDKYVYIGIQKTFDGSNIIRYSDTECVSSLKHIKHPIVRECVRLVPPCQDGIEIVSLADVPAGTGLGSSGAFTVALLKALHVFNNDHISTYDLAAKACRVEIEILNSKIGKQDAFASAYGGINSFNFQRSGGLIVKKIRLTPDNADYLEDNLRLFYTGKTRSASDILSKQNEKTENNDEFYVGNLCRTLVNGERSAHLLEAGNIRKFAEILNEQWDLKGERTDYPEDISRYRERLLNGGALGVKLVGAGGGGFLLSFGDIKPIDFDGFDIPEMKFRFEFEGTKRLI